MNEVDFLLECRFETLSLQEKLNLKCLGAQVEAKF